MSAAAEIAYLEKANELIAFWKDRAEHFEAVVDAAVVYIHAVEIGHHGPYGPQIKKALKNLHEEVAAYDEWIQDL